MSQYVPGPAGDPSEEFDVLGISYFGNEHTEKRMNVTGHSGPRAAVSHRLQINKGCGPAIVGLASYAIGWLVWLVSRSIFVGWLVGTVSLQHRMVCTKHPPF